MRRTKLISTGILSLVMTVVGALPSHAWLGEDGGDPLDILGQGCGSTICLDPDPDNEIIPD